MATLAELNERLIGYDTRDDTRRIENRTVAAKDPGLVLTVTRKAIASAMAVIARADDSSGIIGHACRRLLDLHPVVPALRARPQAGGLDDRLPVPRQGRLLHRDPSRLRPRLA